MSPSNYGRVSLGQDVEVKLDSNPEGEFGFLRGKVIEVSEVPTTENNYIVIVSFGTGLRTTTNDILPYREGLLGSCKILTEKMSLLKRLRQHF